MEFVRSSSDDRFEKKPFQFWREIWIQVIVTLLQLMDWSGLMNESSISKMLCQHCSSLFSIKQWYKGRYVIRDYFPKLHRKGNRNKKTFLLFCYFVILTSRNFLFFVYPIFSSFGCWYFGHFSCMIFFSFFSHLAHLALQNVNIIFSYFRNFFSKSDQKPKPKNWMKEAKVPHFTEGCFINCPGVILRDFHWDEIIFKSQLLWNLIWIVDPFYPF